MNKSLYRLVFHSKLGLLVPVAEIQRVRGKSAADRAAPEPPAGHSAGALSARAGVPLKPLVVALGLALRMLPLGAALPFSVPAGTLPTGSAVSAGAGSVTVAGNTLTVQQLSPILGLNWQSFSIGAGNTVIFQQPSASALAVNRVIGNSRSEIYGTLQANGQMFLINPNGIIFGASAQVDVAGLLASTAGALSQDSHGAWQLANFSDAGVVNQGALRATRGGYIVLAGHGVSNSGSLLAPQGGVALAAAETLSLALDSGNLVQVKVSGGLLQALVENKGLILAEGGAVYLTAVGKDTLLSTVVNNAGVIDAQSMGERAGRVVLSGAGGDVLNQGTIDVSGGHTGERGGTVILSGSRVGVLDGALMDASGDAAGGQVLIGGDSLGRVAGFVNVPLAQHTVVAANATIKVGSGHGHGGFVETSGETLSMLGHVDGASAGQAGEWLIDPSNISISTGASSATNSSNVWSCTAAAGVVNNASIETALNSGTNVTVSTAGAGAGTGTINVIANIAKTAGANVTLNLSANNSITLNGNITATTGALNLNVAAGTGAPGNGSVTFSQNISTNGGNLTVTGGANVGGISTGATGLVFDTRGGQLALTGASNASAGVALSGLNIQSGSGGISITGVSTCSSSAATGVNLSNSTLQSSTGRIAINGTANGGSGVCTSSRTILQAGGGNLTVNGSSATREGVNVSDTSWASGGGNVSITGSAGSTSFASVLMNNAALATGGGSLNLASNPGTPGSGVFLSNTSAASGAGALTLSALLNSSGNALSLTNVSLNGSAVSLLGNTTSGVALRLVNVTLAGTCVTANASATTGFGVYIGQNANNYLTVANGSTFVANGTSTSGAAVVMAGGNASATSTLNGCMSFTGTTHTGTGFTNSWGGPENFAISDGSHVTFTAYANYARALVMSGGGINLAANASLELTAYGGLANLSDSLWVSGVSINQMGGVLNITGVSGKGIGTAVDFRGDSTLNQAGGVVNIHGTSADGVGVRLTSGTVLQSGNGALNIWGESTNGTGVAMNGVPALGTNVTTTAFANGSSVAVTTTSVINASNTSQIDLSTVTNTTTGGTTTTTTANATSTLGILVINQSSAAATLNITGASTNGNGVVMQGVQVLAAGTVNLSGTSTSGTGLLMGGQSNLVGPGANLGQTLNNDFQYGASHFTSQSFNASSGNLSSCTTGVSAVNGSNSSWVDMTTSTTNYNATTGAVTSNVTTAATRLIPSTTFTALSGSQVRVDGLSANGSGVVLNGLLHFNVASAHDLTIHGTTTNASAEPGVIIASRETCATQASASSNSSVAALLDVVGANGANVTIHGTAVSAPGLLVSGRVAINANQAANLNLVGDSSSGQGILLGGVAYTTQSTQTTSLNGTAGPTLYSNLTLGSTADFNATLDSNVSLIGTTASGAIGVQIGGNPGASALFVPTNTSAVKTVTSLAGVVNSTVQTNNYSASAGVANATLAVSGDLTILGSPDVSIGVATVIDVNGKTAITAENNVSIAGTVNSKGPLSVTAVTGAIATTDTAALNSADSVTLAAANAENTTNVTRIEEAFLERGRADELTKIKQRDDVFSVEGRGVNAGIEGDLQ